MDLGEVDWGDVLLDTGEVLVCQGRLGDEDVVVKRWAAGVLDAELAARRALQHAAVSAAPLLGHGPGWMCLGDLSQTMWRRAAPQDIAGPGTLPALGCWLALVHGLSGETLPTDGLVEVLEPDVVAAAVTGLAGVPGSLAQAVERWRTTLADVTPALLVGGFAATAVVVVGDGLDAMVDDLSQAHRGAPAADLWLLGHQLGDDALAVARSGYLAVDGARWPSPEEFTAAEGLWWAAGVVVAGITGGAVDPAAPRRLQQLCRS